MQLRSTLLQAMILIISFFAVNSVLAHEVRPSIIDLAIDDTGRYQLTFKLNLEALIAQIDQKHNDTDSDKNSNKYKQLRVLSPEKLKKKFTNFLPYFIENNDLRVNDNKQVFISIEAIIPDVGDTDLARDSEIYITGILPKNSTQLSWRWRTDFGSAVFRVSTASNKELYSAYLLEGKSTGNIPLNLSTLNLSALNLSALNLSNNAGITNKTAQKGIKQGGCAFLRQAQDKLTLSSCEAFISYIEIGFVHIIPKGLDHILFVVGLFLLSATFRPLLLQITTFTLAHSVTLALGVYGVITIPPAIVEPLIAASIVYVCIENIFFTKLTRWRPVIIFLFGLLHGLGFASVLKEIGLSSDNFISSLIAFNIGVELGQLSIIILCFLAVGLWFRKRLWYRNAITIPASVLIAFIATYWFFQRIEIL